LVFIDQKMPSVTPSSQAVKTQSGEFAMASLVDPIRVGAIEAPNRIFMARLTRGRSTRDHVPTPIKVEYYVKRATAGLIVTETTGISRHCVRTHLGTGVSRFQCRQWPGNGCGIRFIRAALFRWSPARTLKVNQVRREG
jgi:NADH:flavin oxidoreductase / NADH oxidase family